MYRGTTPTITINCDIDVSEFVTMWVTFRTQQLATYDCNQCQTRRRGERTMSKKLMIVDDSRVVYASMSKMLENSGWEIAQFCRSGEEALKTYPDIQPDVVTMDIVMPGMDGLETARRLLEKWPAAKILFVSSLAYDEMVAQSNALGAKGFLYKPFHREEFLTKLADIVSV